MGELLESIFGGGRPRNPAELGPVPGAPPGFPGFAGGSYSPGMGGMTEGVMGFPSINRGGISEAGAFPQGDPLPVPGGDIGGEDIVVEGRRPFKPKKRSLWGVIGDAILLNQGHKGQFFADRKRGQNVRRAMENFHQDPLGAIQNLSQIPGMEERALELYGRLRDDDRADRAQESLADSRKEKVMNSLSGLAGAVYEDGSNYHIVRDRWNNTIRRNNIDDVAELPEEYDPDLMRSIYMGGMTPNQKEMNDIRRIREARQQQQGDARIGIAQQNADTSAGRAAVAERQGDARIGIAQQNADNYAKKGGKNGPVAPGKEGDTVVHPDGKNVKTFHQGKWHYYEVITGPDGKPKRGKFLGAK